MRATLAMRDTFSMSAQTASRIDSSPVANVQCTSILLVDGSAAVLSGLAYLIVTEAPRLRIAGTARTVEGAYTLARTACPQVIVADVFSDSGGGLDSLVLLLSSGKPVVVLSCRDDPATRALALRAGACAFVSKLAPAAELLAAIARAAVA